MLDVLNKHFQNILHVSKTQSGSSRPPSSAPTSCWPSPRRFSSAASATRRASWWACWAWPPAPSSSSPPALLQDVRAFLVALFVLSSGLACIETAANPYVTVLGPKEGAAGRLSVAQAFNSLAYILAPTIGGALIFRKQVAEGEAADFGSLLLPYVSSAAWSWSCSSPSPPSGCRPSTPGRRLRGERSFRPPGPAHSPAHFVWASPPSSCTSPPRSA